MTLYYLKLNEIHINYSDAQKHIIFGIQLAVPFICLQSWSMNLWIFVYRGTHKNLDILTHINHQTIK